MVSPALETSSGQAPRLPRGFRSERSERRTLEGHRSSSLAVDCSARASIAPPRRRSLHRQVARLRLALCLPSALRYGFDLRLSLSGGTSARYARSGPPAFPAVSALCSGPPTVGRWRLLQAHAAGSAHGASDGGRMVPLHCPLGARGGVCRGPRSFQDCGPLRLLLYRLDRSRLRCGASGVCEQLAFGSSP
jgi:hypothetical protein